MVTRRIGKILRGKATPFQLFAACVLGALLGFAPGLVQGPATFVLLVAALLVVNANLGLALVIAALAKLLSYLVVPLSFRIGQFLLDGPTAGLFESLLNAPILAWSGLEYYAYAGGMVVGLALGIGLGFALVRLVGGFRRRMLAAQEHPGRMQELASKPWARALIWLFFGGTGRKSWEQKLAKRVGNPIRVWGAALLVLALVGAWFAQKEFAGPLVREHLVAGLERTNGATVDVAGLRIDLNEARFGIDGLALADPNQLTEDLFRAAELEADVDQLDFLRRRVHVAKVVVRDAESGAARAEPGVRTRPKPAPVEEPAAGGPRLPGDYSLEDVVTDVELWKSRLSQVRSWLDRLAGEPDAEAAAAEDDESFAERIEREVRERGWFNVAANVAEEAPTLLLSELVVDGLKTSYLPGRVFDLSAHELSTHPGLVDAPPRLALTSRDGAIAFGFDLSPASRAGGDGALSFSWKGLAVDDVLAKLKLPGGSPLRGGTLDLELDGSWLDGRIGHLDLPLRATFRDTVLQVGKLEPTPLDSLVLPIGLSGAIDAPRIHLDSSALSDALVAAGRQELANRLQGELGQHLDRLEQETGLDLPQDLDELKEKAAEGLTGELEALKNGELDADSAKDALGGLLGKKKKKD